MKVLRGQTLILLWIALGLSGGHAFGQPPPDDSEKITFAIVQSKPATICQRYVGRIDSHRRIEVRTPTEGYIAAVPVKEGQAVNRGDLLFQVEPATGKEKPGDEDPDKAVSIKAPFDGLIGRLPRQQGSLVLKGETLTTLSDNSVMWVYFDVPESSYLKNMAELSENQRDPDLALMLADQSKFPHAGKLGAIGAEFNDRTGTITFRADFPNPDGLLRHGQTGIVSIRRVFKDAVLVPQRATLEFLGKRYVYVVDKDQVPHKREIVIRNEPDSVIPSDDAVAPEDFFVVKKGVAPGDKIVLRGVDRVIDGYKVE